MLKTIRIDDTTWSSASRARQMEWEIEIRDLVDDPELVIDERIAALHINLGSQGFTLSARSEDGSPVDEVLVPHDALRTHVQEYVHVVRQMERVEQGMASARLEVLDMAKKVTHDSAGRTLRRLCRPFCIDLQTGRGLFSLLFSLRIDTTELNTVRAHRPIR